MWRKLGKQVVETALRVGTAELAKRAKRRGHGSESPSSRQTSGNKQTMKRPPAPRNADGYLGDYTGSVNPSYDPQPDDDADPGEVVWAWVPYEEDHSQGKDRPVLVLARLDGHLLALPLTSKDHDRDAAQEARAGRTWMDVGSGSWDSRGRPSEVRLDRVLQLRYSDVRREGASLDKGIFHEVAREAQKANDWS